MFILTRRACVLALTRRAYVRVRATMQGIHARINTRVGHVCSHCTQGMLARTRWIAIMKLNISNQHRTSKSIEQNKCNSCLINNIKRKRYAKQHFPAQCIQSWRYNQDTILHPGVRAHMVDTVCWQQHMRMVA